MLDKTISTALVAGLALVSAAAASAAPRAAGGFDGNWSVEVLTDKGDCERVYRYPIVIQNGAVRYGGSEDFSASGSVAANGAVRGSISRDTSRADVSGRLSGASGTGTWQTSGGCSGHWRAEKRG